MARKFSGTAADPTLVKTPVTLDGVEYNLCFDYKALAQAEAAFKKEGYYPNLLVNMYDFSLESVLLVFPCAVRKFHPELGWEGAQALVTLATANIIADAIANAWIDSQPKAKEEPPPPANPQEPLVETNAGSDSGQSQDTI
jgi:hypothetical protein